MLARSFVVNKANVGDGQEMLRQIQPGSVAAAFFDPQYRALNSKMAYGDETTGRMKHVHALPAMPESMIRNMIIDIETALKPWGHLFFWVDKFMLVNGVMSYLSLTDLKPVDMIVWDKVRIGMGYRSRRTSEYLVVLQKPKDGETRAKGVWRDRGIKDVWAEPAVRNHHPHHKPIALLQRLIECVTDPEDTIVDPAAGSFAVVQAALLAVPSPRNCLACDLVNPAVYHPA